MSDFMKKNITKTKLKKKKVKAFHQKVKVFRATDPKMAVLMWGVSHSISQLSHVAPPVMLLKDDFKAYSKIKIDNHLYNKENMPAHFKFKEYMPLVFRNLRERFGITEKLFMNSFFIEPHALAQTGHSGSKFFLTNDKKFWVKTMVSEEVEVMHNIMPQYHQYIVEAHTETLLPQYLAMYRTTVDTKEYYYIVLRNVFSPAKKIHKKYDLKGSRIDREAKDSEKENNATPTFKDNDFTQENTKLEIGAAARSYVLEKVKKDVNFLSSLNIMDYSLLVGVHDGDVIDSSDNEDENDNDEEFDTGEDSADALEDVASAEEGDAPQLRPPLQRASSTGSGGNDEAGYDPELFAIHSLDEANHEIYYCGIIDVLSYYGATKKAAHAAKTVKHGAGAEISTVKPQLYASRFIEFIDTIFE